MSGIEFREVMSGRLTIGATDPVAGQDDPAAVPAVLRALIRITDIDEFLRAPGHAGRLLGVLESPRLAAHLTTVATADDIDELVCSLGAFALFAPPPPPATAGHRLMVYDAAVTVDDHRYWMRGRKFIAPAEVWKGWRATTTLHITLHRGPDDGGPVVAAGILRLSAGGLMSLLRSMRATGCDHRYQRLLVVLRFVRFFGSTLIRTYLLRRSP